MDFEYDLHICTKTSFPGSPFEATEEVVHQSGVGTFLEIGNELPCPVFPRDSLHGLASVLTTTGFTSNGLAQRACRSSDFLSRPLTLRLGLNTGFANDQRIFAESTKEVKADDVVQVNLPLGAIFYIAMGDDDTAHIIDVDIVESDIETVTGSTLFPGEAVVEFDETAAAAKKFLLAVHLGETVLELTDADDNSNTIKLEVERPASLGTEQVTFDPVFVEAAHQAGILPSLLKGIADRESGFDPMAYRADRVGSEVLSAGEPASIEGSAPSCLPPQDTKRSR